MMRLSSYLHRMEPFLRDLSDENTSGQCFHKFIYRKYWTLGFEELRDNLETLVF